MHDLVKIYLGEWCGHFVYDTDERDGGMEDFVAGAKCILMNDVMIGIFDSYCVLEWVSCSMPSYVMESIGGEVYGSANRNWYKKYGLGDPGSVELCVSDVGLLVNKIRELRCWNSEY
jgi:hypothetical protein